ncbi:MAG: tRNA dihydrouridine synthase DusB [Bacteroidales bacterium]
MRIGTVEIPGFPVLAAPMEDITDPPFRHLCKRFGADIVYTEFISADGLIRDAVKSLQKLDFSEEERPVGIQIFGSNAENMAEATRVATAANPDLIDINFGCPVRKVAMKGGGAGLLNDIPRMVEITRAMVRSTHLPVTVKTRLGWDEHHKEILDIALRLQDEGISAITIHGRTRAQMYRGKADWTLIGRVKEHPGIHIPVIGNGDITSGPAAVEMKEKYGVDGVMIGRGMIGNPWIFREIRHYAATGEILPPPTLPEIVEICKEHLIRSVEWKGERVGLFEMRKHYGQYFKGLPGVKEFRSLLVRADSAADVMHLLDHFFDFVR